MYWAFAKRFRIQNIILLAASYLFYGFWDYRFLSLIVLSSIVDYVVGSKLGTTENEKQRKLLLAISVFTNLGILFVFKYFSFFVDSFAGLLQNLNISANISTLHIILPVGISFYTFQTMSYTIDVYKNRIQPTTNIISFFTYVAFFPQLVAGPIERAGNLLPQFEKERIPVYSNFSDGMRQILWGLFKKIVVADNCAVIVDYIFSNQADVGSGMLWIAAILFVIQIYCDFSGYTDIAIGSARLLGIDLMQNFANPYFSTSLTDFWRRWHISLSTFFRDYLFKPLQMRWRYSGQLGLMGTIFITFTLIGFWHGANWTFILFGLLHSIYFAVETLTAKKRKRFRKSSDNNKAIMQFGGWLLTMLFWIMTCVIFRSPSISDSFTYLSQMFLSDVSWLEGIKKVRSMGVGLSIIVLLSTIVFVIEWINKSYSHGLFRLSQLSIVRYAVYILLTLSVIEFYITNQPFIYFQF